MSRQEHERFVEQWWEKNSEIDSENELLLEFLWKSPQLLEEFKADHKEVLIKPLETLGTMNEEMYNLFLKWFEASSYRLKAWYDWLEKRIPDGPVPDFDTTEEAEGLR